MQPFVPPWALAPCHILDAIALLRQGTLLPNAACQVSGEYALIKFATAAGAGEEARVVRESLGAFKRAGLDLILTCFAMAIARHGFREQGT